MTSVSFLVNAACGTGEQIVLQGLDDVAAAAKYMMSAPGKDGNVWIPSAEGQHVCAGQLDATWTQSELGNLQGRALDLKSAYKQLARSPQDDWCSILAVCLRRKGQFVSLNQMPCRLGLSAQ